MQHIGALLLKILAVVAVLWIVMDPIFNVFSASTAIVTGIVLALLSYAGDLILVPRTKNIIAVAVDFVLAGLVVWLAAISAGSLESATIWGGLVTVLLISAFEYPFHHYLAQKVLWYPHQAATNL
ncbi:DUF2512 family protein [Salibacterium aidingense]|uniref:DUF2512 family protein n=1 Tax=Salibacterium aidingense TaxID=384933 RepID=UPI003BDA3934